VADLLTAENELTYITFPIAKTETTADGDLVVYGKATDGSVDSDQQIVDPDWSAKALQQWLDTGGNVRVQHNAQRDPAGKGLAVEVTPDGHWVKSLIVEPVAKDLVSKGVLRAYSVGISRPVIEPDVAGKALGGVIRGGPQTEICEISLVDRPANRNCAFQLVKADKHGAPELVGKVTGDAAALLTKAAAVEDSAAAGTDVTVTLPGDVQVRFTPADMARLVTKSTSDAAAATKRQMDPHVGGGVDRDKIPAADFAGRDRSFPIVKPGDVSDAAASIGRAGADNLGADQLRSNIISIARRKGPSFVAELPDAWTRSNATKGADDTMDDNDGGDDGDSGGGGDAPQAGQDGHGDDGGDDGGSWAGGDSGGGKKKLPPWLKPGKKKAGKKARAAKAAADELSADSQAMQATDPDPVTSPAAAVAKGDDMACAGCGRGLDDSDRFCAGCGKKVKPAKKVSKVKRTPADGVTGVHADPVPAHREPDGPDVEALEHDAGMPTTPDAQVKAAIRLKTLGVPADLGALHDLTCAAFHPDDAAKCHPHADLVALDVDAWQAKALDAAVSAPLAGAQAATRLWQHAVTLRGSDPLDVASLRWEAHKAFRDANPGPGSAPTPTQISATRYRRPLITGGHEAPSPGHGQPNTAAVPAEGGISATGYRRGPIDAGHAADSPANKGGGAPGAADLVTVPASTGTPGRTYYTNVGRNNARQAMAAMHDHIAATFPDLCPMTGNAAPEMQSRPVPTPGGTPDVSAIKSGSTPAGGGQADGRAERKTVKARRRKLVAKVLRGKLTADQARAQLGLAPLAAPAVTPAAPAAVEKAATAPPTATEVAEVVKAAVAEATGTIADQLRQQRELIDRLAGQPDTTSAPYRGPAGSPQQLSGPAGPDTVAKSAERAQATLMAEMERQWRTSPDPTTREAAWESLLRMRGIPNHS
jgi:hypothetical protein